MVHMSDQKGEKFSIYLPGDVLSILDAAAEGMERTRSWLIQQAIKKAVPEIARNYFNILEDTDESAP